ncbi:hypothetical protein PARHAE_03810 [Paracoccus haematequi]|uniref:DUF4435 domain-containing protein n=1 Tax=Paracoccus haematequi TaxID=2491866 RepID=A0A447ISV9_9RHOB|nr:DUF4435 domain-containing protein [Paracoccus haematequi]VDS10594.1 hypothetical protein PARHAE_03810 [Paracoccus haematequi]
MFSRTDSGLTNRAIFTGTQFTLYVEGGGGVKDAGSPDVIFWRQIFSSLRPDVSITIKAHGGKPELETVARKVLAGSVQNTIVAMDSDFDEFLDEKLSHEHILYTYGYSWESDAFNYEVLLEAAGRLARLGPLPEGIVNEFKEQYENYFRRMLPYVNADFRLRQMGSSLFPNVAPGRHISNTPGNYAVNVNIKELLFAYRRELKKIDPSRRRQRPSVYIMSARWFLHGHTLQAYVRCALSYLLRRVGRAINVTDDLVEQLAISIFGSFLLHDNSHAGNHYRRLADAI